jgi:hypothetical protein
MAALVIAGCGPSGRTPDDALRDLLAGGDKCADFTGGWTSRLSGTLHGQRDRARRVAARLIPRDSLGKDHTEQGGRTVRLIPICENHRLQENHLKQGRFVAALTGPGTSPRFSRDENDVVFWWIYGEDVRTSAGRDTTVWHSEFLSLGSDAATRYVVSTHLQICDGAPPTPDREAVHWHDAVCHLAAGGGTGPAGDRPWFGCTRGCCFAAMPTSLTAMDSVRTDSLPRDTTRSPPGA